MEKHSVTIKIYASTSIEISRRTSVRKLTRVTYLAIEERALITNVCASTSLNPNSKFPSLRLNANVNIRDFDARS